MTTKRLYCWCPLTCDRLTAHDRQRVDEGRVGRSAALRFEGKQMKIVVWLGTLSLFLLYFSFSHNFTVKLYCAVHVSQFSLRSILSPRSRDVCTPPCPRVGGAKRQPQVKDERVLADMPTVCTEGLWLQEPCERMGGKHILQPAIGSSLYPACDRSGTEAEVYRRAAGPVAVCPSSNHEIWFHDFSEKSEEAQLCFVLRNLISLLFFFFLISWCDFDWLQMTMKLLFTIPDMDIRYSVEAASKHKVCYEQEWQQQFTHQTKIVENLHHSTMKKVSSYKTWCCVCITDRNETVIQVIPRMIQCLSKQLWYSNTILAP